MVSNVGFREDATHTTGYNKVFSNAVANSIVEIKHPDTIKISFDEDYLTFKRTHKKPKRIVKTILKKIIQSVTSKNKE